MDVRCHICNIDVPRKFIDNHQHTELHKLSLKLINESVDRLKKHVNETTISFYGTRQNNMDDDDGLLCEDCSFSHEGDTCHEKSRRHLDTKHYIKRLKDFVELYFTPTNDSNENPYKPKLTTIQKYVIDVSDKYSIQHLTTFDEDHLELRAVNSRRLKIDFDKFHSLTGDVQYVYCRLCHKGVSNNLKMEHIYSDDHVDKIKNQFPDENCITERDKLGFCYCLLCSVNIFYVDVYQHITNDLEHKVNVKNALISEHNDNLSRNVCDNPYSITNYEIGPSIKGLVGPKKRIMDMETSQPSFISNTLTNRKVLIDQKAELEHEIPLAFFKTTKVLKNLNKFHDAIPTQDLIDLTDESLTENKTLIEELAQTSIASTSTSTLTNKEILIHKSNAKLESEIPIAFPQTTEISKNLRNLNDAGPTHDRDLTDKGRIENKIEVQLEQPFLTNNTLINRDILVNQNNAELQNEISCAFLKTTEVSKSQNILNDAGPSQDRDVTDKKRTEDKIETKLELPLIINNTLENKDVLVDENNAELQNEIPLPILKTTNILTNQNTINTLVSTQDGDLNDKRTTNQNIADNVLFAPDSNNLSNEVLAKDEIDIELTRPLLSNNTFSNMELLDHEINPELEKIIPFTISETTKINAIQTTLNGAVPSHSDIIDEEMSRNIIDTENITYQKELVDQNDAEAELEVSTATLTDQSIFNDIFNLDDNMGTEITNVQDNLKPFDKSDRTTILPSDSEITMSTHDNEQPKLEDIKQIIVQHDLISDKNFSLAARYQPTKLKNMQLIEEENNSGFIKPIKIQTIQSNNTLNHVLQSGYNSKTLSCRVCLMKLPKNVNVVNDHLNGTRHTINYQTMLLNNKLVIENNKTFCQACENWMYVGELFDHIISDTHLNRIHPDKLFAEKVDVYEEGTICSVCDSDVSGASIDEHEKGRRHQIMIKEIATANTLRTLCQSLNDVGELQHDDIEVSNERTKLQNYIDLITREYPAEHKINVLNHIYLEITAVNGEKIIISKDQFHTLDVSATMAGCYLCGILVNGREKIKLHINSEVHKRNAMADFEDRHCIRKREGTSFSFPYYCLLCQGSVHHLSIDIHKQSIDHIQKVDKVILSRIAENITSNSIITEAAVKIVCHPTNPIEKPSTSENLSHGAIKKSVAQIDNKSQLDQRFIVNDHRVNDREAAASKEAIAETRTNDYRTYDKSQKASVNYKVPAAKASAVNDKGTAIKIEAAAKPGGKNKVTPAVKPAATRANVEFSLDFQLVPTKYPQSVLCRICNVLVPNNKHNITTHLQGLRHAHEFNKFLNENNMKKNGCHLQCTRCQYNVGKKIIFDHIETHKNENYSD